MLWLCLLFLFTNIFYMSVSTSNESKVKQSYISSILEINQKYPLLNQICENLGPESTNPESTNIFSKTFAENKRDIDNINELINACEKIAKDEYPDYGSIHKNLIGQINELSNRISKRHKNMFTSPINSLNAPSRHGLPPFQHQELLQPHPLHIQQSKIFQPYEISNNLPKQHITGHTIPINQLMSQNIP
ncbi:hypothetical protein Mgra_00005132 [Meloidogyne graminicola]|nr:hypothetical protein Mgra_00005132 [Meloidogyne graminicola]